MSVLERLNKALKLAFQEINIYKKSDMAKFLGYTNSYFSEITNGKENLSESFLNVISEKVNINLEWVLSGEGDVLKNKELFINEVTPIPKDDYMMVEYADLRASAGRLGGSNLDMLPYTHKRLIPSEFNNGNFLVVRVDGDSMYDGTARSLSDGDEVLIKERTVDQWYDLPIRKSLFVITSREGNVLKQITEINKEEGYIICHSFNPRYEDFKLYFTDIFQIFIVRKVVQKQISLI